MMGYGHALMGGAAFLGVVSTSSLALGAAPMPLGVEALGALICAGAALAPDLDHHDATIAHSIPSAMIMGRTIIPSPTRALARVVERASGGHRHYTHSLIGIAAAGLVGAALAPLALPSPWPPGAAPHWTGLDTGSLHPGAGVATLLLGAMAIKALGMNRLEGSDLGTLIIRSWIGPWIMALALAAWASAQEAPWFPLLPSTIALGCLIHCLGDTLTNQGVAWFQPYTGPAPGPWKQWRRSGTIIQRATARAVLHCWRPNGYIRLPILGDAGSARELILDTALGSYALYLLAHDLLARFAPTIHLP